MRALLVVVFVLVVVNVQTCNFTIGAFGPTGDFLYQYANSNGLFPAGFSVCFVAILNSTDQYLRLKAGDFQVMSGFADNVIGKAMAVDSVRDPDLCLLSGGDLGPHQTLSGNIANGIRTLSDLQNKPILVDSPDTGAVVILYKILHDAGIMGNTFVQAGGASRLSHLIAGTYNGNLTYATMNFYPSTVPPLLNPALDNVARAKDYYWPYQNVAYGSTCSWAQANKAVLVAYFEGIASAYYWFKTNPTAAMAYFAAHNPTWTSAFVTSYYNSYFGTDDGVVTSYSLIPHRAALCKDIVTRQAIQNYGLGEFPTYVPMGTDTLADPWTYVIPTLQPNKENLIEFPNKYRGPVYTDALETAINNVKGGLGAPPTFPWEHPTSRCWNLCDINTRYPGDGVTIFPCIGLL
jgi:ABC-type nitrate/sulfonate/bicarbonate transport system substrate-binding protein